MFDIIDESRSTTTNAQVDGSGCIQSVCRMTARSSLHRIRHCIKRYSGRPFTFIMVRMYLLLLLLLFVAAVDFVAELRIRK